MTTIDGRIELKNVIAAWEPHLAEQVARLVAGDTTGHDIYHCLRVKRMALLIAAGENLDEEVLVATAYLHDVGRGVELREGSDHVQIGVSTAEELLPRIGFPSTKRLAVIHCIKHHEEYDWVNKRMLPASEFREVLGFQDADRLDAIGAIGIARMFSFGGAHGQPLWIPEIGPKSWRPGDTTSSSYNHLSEKLLNLKDAMNTPTGAKLAQVRHQFMTCFIQEFEREWHGDV